MQAMESQGQIYRIEIENFKCYKGYQIIGPFGGFTAIIGPNDSGKSDLMDAISFVLGGGQLNDLIYASHGRASVKLVYRLGDGSEVLFTRTITSAGGSEYQIGNIVVNWDEYSGRLKSLGIAGNFLVFQGDVESVASKDPKELTKLLEQISGSDKYKRLYEDLEEKKGAAEEKSRLANQKKRTIAMERKQKKEEAKRHKQLQEQLRSLKKKHFLWQLFNTENDEKAIEEIDTESRSLLGIRSELESYENESRKKEKEQAQNRDEIDKFEKKIAQKKNKIDKNQPELLKLKEETKLKNTGKELDQRKEETKKHYCFSILCHGSSILGCKEALITQLPSKCKLEQIILPTVAAPVPVYDFSQLSSSHQQKMIPAEREKLEAEFNQKIGGIISEIDSTAPNQYAALQEKERAASKELKEAREEEQQIGKQFESVRNRRLTRFIEAFNHISGNIDKIYKQLTKSSTHPLGGTAYLNLDNEDEPFLHGIKYTVMPPTKRFPYMEQLSCGEKTVAALALLFSIHSYKPSPFFILDEVDAALDDLNVAKVAEFIRSKSCDGGRASQQLLEVNDFQSITISRKASFYNNAEVLIGVYRDFETGGSRTLTFDLRKTIKL